MIEVAETLKGRSFTRVADFAPDELELVLDLATRMKASPREDHVVLPGRALGMIFQKPSTRTRVSFEVGIAQLGGYGLYMRADDLQLGRGETIRDTATVLSRYLDAIVIRTFAQSDVEELAEHADIPVINGLTDETHPCQALADMLTISERLGRLEGVRIVYLGDGNNVCASLMVAASRLGSSFVAATPTGYEPDERAVAVARSSGGEVDVVTTPPRRCAARTSSTRTSGRAWARKRSASGGFATSPASGSRRSSWVRPETARSSCTVCPAHYGEEITEDVLYGPQSAVWDQAENRLHAQKALMALVVR